MNNTRGSEDCDIMNSTLEMTGPATSTTQETFWSRNACEIDRIGWCGKYDYEDSEDDSSEDDSEDSEDREDYSEGYGDYDTDIETLDSSEDLDDSKALDGRDSVVEDEGKDVLLNVVYGLMLSYALGAVLYVLWDMYWEC
ncbi:hypothetical protein E4T43_05142 [Aureobasidium subglaciale]|nr:hypothetical protein E4T43_05142 [Aureobasidium subglaciale]